MITQICFSCVRFLERLLVKQIHERVMGLSKTKFLTLSNLLDQKSHLSFDIVSSEQMLPKLLVRSH